MEKPKVRGFEASLAIEKDLKIEQFEKINNLIDLLNEKLEIQTYTKSLKGLLIVFQCFHPENEYIKVNEYSSHKRKKGLLELYLTIEYEKAIKSSPDEIYSLLIESFLSAIKKFINYKDFNTQAFVKDVSSLFIDG